jgi:ssDNA-specific exonuclease RecJ
MITLNFIGHRGTSLKMKATFPRYQEQVLQSMVRIFEELQFLTSFL